MDDLNIGDSIELSDYQNGRDAPHEVWIAAGEDHYEPGWGKLSAQDVPKVIAWLQAWLDEHG